MRPEQQQYCDAAQRGGNKRLQNGLLNVPTKSEVLVYQTFCDKYGYKRQVDGTPTEEGAANNSVLWCFFFKYGLPITPDNMKAAVNSAELAGLLNRVEQPAQPTVTADEFAQAHAELAQLHTNDWPGAEPILNKLDANWRAAEEKLASLDKSWRGEGRQPSNDGQSGAPYPVRYSTPQNLAKMILRCAEEGVLVEGAMLLLAFRYLLGDGQLVAVPNEQRKTHDAPATPASIRAAREADAKKHADQRQSVHQIREMRDRFKEDYNTVLYYSGPAMGGSLRGYHLKYAGQKQGLKDLHTRWDGKFTGDDLRGYEKLMKELEAKIEELGPSGGVTRVTDKDARAIEGRAGGSISDVPVADEAARQERNRQLLGGNVTNPRPRN